MNNTATTAAESKPPEVLRADMVEHITSQRPTSPEVADAMGVEPRHIYVREAPVTEAYDPLLAVITKRAADGSALSCASVPELVALMLDQLQVVPGMNVLEIGAGTGYNAGLLQRLVASGGRVTTVDIDPEVTAGARAALDEAGHPAVEVITRDGVLGAEENGPYDRIIFTVGAWDITEALWRQLKVGGRMVVPLRWRGQTRTIGFARTEDALVADTIELCGFVPLVGQEGEKDGAIDDAGLVRLYFDADQAITPGSLDTALSSSRSEVWSGATVGPIDPFDGVWLRLTATEPGTCRIGVEQAAKESGLCTPAVSMRSPAIVEDGSFAYFAIRRTTPAPDGESRHELGAIGHGPDGEHLAQRMCEQIRRWDVDRDFRPAITAFPVGTGDERMPKHSMVIDKRDSRLALEI